MKNLLCRIAIASFISTLALATSVQAENPPSLADIAKSLEAINKRLETIETDMRAPDGTAFALKKLQEEVVQLRKQVTALESKAPYTTKRIDTSKSTEPTIRPITNQGKVRFVNDWIEDVSVVVNGVSYEVLIGTELSVPVPAGSFTYQVLNLQRRPMTRSIEADKVWTVTINTRN